MEPRDIIIKALCESIKEKELYIKQLEDTVVYHVRRLNEAEDSGNARKTSGTK